MIRRVAILLAFATVAAAGCAQPGTQVPPSQAAELGVGTSRIAVACGTAEELRAFGGSRSPGLDGEDSIAISGDRKLAEVYKHDATDLYQGESVGAVIHDSISLLGSCRLTRAQKFLMHILAKHT